jgi:gliding motility-associated-like protein
VIEKDNIRNLFSKALENHTSPVRPEVWNGLQAKMAAAGFSSGAAAAKGISALAKWLIGSAAVSVAAVITVVLVNQNDAPSKPKAVRQETTRTAAAEKAPDAAAINGTEQENSKRGAYSTTTPGNRTLSGYSPAVTNIPESVQPSNTGTLIPPNIEDGTAVVPKGVEPHSPDQPSKKQEEPEKQETNPAAVPNERPAPAVEEYSSKISKIPNFFSPNNDGENDFLFIESQHLKEFTLVISNTKGVVWTSNDPAFRWDGTAMNGDPVPAGTYSLVIMARDTKGKLIREFSTVDIRR